jgi:hypothetical protein
MQRRTRIVTWKRLIGFVSPILAAGLLIGLTTEAAQAGSVTIRLNLSDGAINDAGAFSASTDPAGAPSRHATVPTFQATATGQLATNTGTGKKSAIVVLTNMGTANATHPAAPISTSFSATFSSKQMSGAINGTFTGTASWKFGGPLTCKIGFPPLTVSCYVDILATT